MRRVPELALKLHNKTNNNYQRHCQDITRRPETKTNREQANKNHRVENRKLNVGGGFRMINARRKMIYLTIDILIR